MGYLDGVDSNLKDFMTNHYLNSVEASDIGLTSTDDLDDIVSKIPDNTTVKLWINDNTTYGSQVRDEIGINVYGYLYVYSTDSATSVVHFILFSYQGNGVYFKTYTGVNDYGWSSSWINLSQPTLTSSRALISNSSGKVAVSAVTSTELGYLDGVTSAIQTQLNGKASSSHTHTGTQVKGLTANRALISNSSGQVSVSGVTNTELGYLDGVKSNIQTQINNLTANSKYFKFFGCNLTSSSATADGGLATLQGTSTAATNFVSGTSIYAVPLYCAYGIPAASATITTSGNKVTIKQQYRNVSGGSHTLGATVLVLCVPPGNK